MAVPRDTQAPFPGIPGYPAKAGNQWLVICCPFAELGHVTWSPRTQVCGVNTDVLYRDCPLATGHAAQLLMFCVLFNQDFPIFLYICFL